MKQSATRRRVVLVHVGFAMSVINEAEARDTLDALQKTCLTLSQMSARCCGEENNAFC